MRTSCGLFHTRLALTDGLHLLRTAMSFASKFFNKTVCTHTPHASPATHTPSTHLLLPYPQLSGVRDAFSTPHTVYHDKVRTTRAFAAHGTW